MKLQDAYNTLDMFLDKHGAGLVEREALKAMTAYCKGVETKRGNKNAVKTKNKKEHNDTSVDTTPVQPDTPPQDVQPTPQPNPLPSFVKPKQEPEKKPVGIPDTTNEPTASTHKNRSGQPWTAAEERELLQQHLTGMTITDMAKQHGRSADAIMARLVRMGVIS